MAARLAKATAEKMSDRPEHGTQSEAAMIVAKEEVQFRIDIRAGEETWWTNERRIRGNWRKDNDLY
jgi:hypothetical protein